MFKKILQQIGLNSNEAKVYLAALKLGTQDVSMIARETGISRYDVIMIISELLERGFMSKFAFRKDFFTAEPPEIVAKTLEGSGHLSQARLRAFKKMLPQFQAFMNPALIRPEISFYEGKEGIITAYEDTLTSKTDILAVASIDDAESTFPRYVPRYYQRRKAAGILVKAIFPDTPMARARHKKDQKELRISRLVPKEHYHFTIEMNIYDDKVAYFSLREQLAVIIKSPGIAESMRNVFDLCWKMAAVYDSRM